MGRASNAILLILAISLEAELQAIPCFLRRHPPPIGMQVQS